MIAAIAGGVVALLLLGCRLACWRRRWKAKKLDRMRLPDDAAFEGGTYGRAESRNGPKEGNEKEEYDTAGVGTNPSSLSPEFVAYNSYPPTPTMSSVNSPSMHSDRSYGSAAPLFRYPSRESELGYTRSPDANNQADPFFTQSPPAVYNDHLTAQAQPFDPNRFSDSSLIDHPFTGHSAPLVTTGSADHYAQDLPYTPPITAVDSTTKVPPAFLDITPSTSPRHDSMMFSPIDEYFPRPPESPTNLPPPTVQIQQPDSIVVDPKPQQQLETPSPAPVRPVSTGPVLPGNEWDFLDLLMESPAAAEPSPPLQQQQTAPNNPSSEPKRDHDTSHGEMDSLPQTPTTPKINLNGSTLKPSAGEEEEDEGPTMRPPQEKFVLPAFAPSTKEDGKMPWEL